MIESKNDTSKNLEKALQALKQAQQWTPAEGVVCLAAAKRGNYNSPSQAALATL